MRVMEQGLTFPETRTIRVDLWWEHQGGRRKMFNPICNSFILYNCHNPAQPQLNLTQLRLDIIIKPNPHTTPKNYQKFPTLPGTSMTTAWCEADIRLSEELTTQGYRQVKEGRRVYARIQTAQLSICLKHLWFSTVHIEEIMLHEWQTYQWKAYL